MSNENGKFDEWVVLELLGHRRLAGHLTEAEIGGAKFLRLDVPEHGEKPAMTQFYGPGSVYCLTPVTEAIARAVATSYRLEPVQRYELAQLAAPVARSDEAAEVQGAKPAGDDETCIHCGAALLQQDSDVCGHCLDRGF